MLRVEREKDVEAMTQVMDRLSEKAVECLDQLRTTLQEQRVELAKRRGPGGQGPK